MQLSKEMTAMNILRLLTCRGTANVTLPNGIPGILLSIEREDGSGQSFNIKVKVNECWHVATMTVHVRTID